MLVDTVAHQRLIAKLDHSGIRGHILTCISSFLTGRRQRVVFRNRISDWISVKSGVPQGSILQIQIQIQNIYLTSYM